MSSRTAVSGRVRMVVLVAGLALAALAGATAVAATPARNALYTGKVQLPDYASKRKIVKLRVSSDAEHLKFTGPHERCGTPESPKGFNVAAETVGMIPKVKIKNDGSFSAHREYRATYTSPAGGVYNFDWDIHVSGRFVSTNKAKGTTSYEMMTSSNRGPVGPPRSCGRKKVSFTATRK